MLKQKKISRIAKRSIECLQLIIIAGMGIVICLPVALLLWGSFADEIEWAERLHPYIADNMEYIQWKWIPDFPTLSNYKEVLFFSPEFLTLFWNSVKLVLCILIGQCLIGIHGAWAFAVYDFRGKNVLFCLYVILMLLPFQVTMLSKYLVLNRLSMLDTHAAVILPAVFSTLPVFLVYRGFSGIAKELLDVARLDGAGELAVFWRIGVPLAKNSIMAAHIMGFLEGWNMIEEPLAFLKDRSLWPLSLYLPEISMELAGEACAASVITLVVSTFLFVIFGDYLERGIISSAIK